jgi:manganese efflux pump family protein
MNGLALWELLLLAVGLAMDAFAVAVATGLLLQRVTARHTFRIAFHFGLFQFLMPVIGWSAGHWLSGWLSAWDHWIALVLLGYVGVKMLWEAREGKLADAARDPTRGWLLVTLSVATSVDALAVGFSLAMLDVSIWMPSVVIGLVAALLSAVGILFGGRIGARWGRTALIAGGIVLILIGLKILLDHTAG